MKFTERFAELMQEQDEEQKEIAEKLHITPANISNWKTGRNVPSIETLYEICKLMNVSADWLLGLSDYKDIMEKGW